MRIVLQRVSQASVTINNTQHAVIGKGLLVLLSVEQEDDEEDIIWLCQKIIKMRIFGDENGAMNLSVKDVNGDILVVSQFTLHASTKKGNRPSFIKAAHPNHALPMYKKFKQKCTDLLGKEIKSGEFGANMQVGLVNDGPITIIIDSKNKN